MNNNSIAFTLGRNSYNKIPSIKYKILIKMNNWQLTLHNENYKMKIQQQNQYDMQNILLIRIQWKGFHLLGYP